MASSSSSKKKSGASHGAPRSYSEIYKSSAANAAPPATVPAKPDSGAPKSNGVAVRKAEAAPVALATSDQVDWRGEYGYVLADLRYLGIVTVALLIGIVVVGLFL